MAADAALVLDARAELGEGPIWDAAAGRLLWVDIMRGRVHAFDPASGCAETRDVGRPVGSVVPSRDGSIVLATSRGFERLDWRSGRVSTIAEVESDRPGNRMNDGACDPAGRFWAGTMAIDESPGAGALYRLDPDGRVSTMVGRVSISNGIGWSGDARRMFYIDSPTQRIDVFDYDAATGAIANRRPLARIARERGVPDGLTLDADGFLWVALWGGSALHRYAPDGRLDRVVELPASHPTKCAFGGASLDELFVTTATIAQTAAQKAAQPHGGGVYRITPGVRGCAAYVFDG
jgi:sugar lactone lactonase YvrE